MANTQNLVSLADRTQRERNEIARKGAEASNRVQRERRLLRELANEILDREITAKGTGQRMTTGEAMLLKQVEKALKGDTRAFQMVRDTAGQAPVQQVEMSALREDQAKFRELLEQFGEAGE